MGRVSIRTESGQKGERGLSGLRNIRAVWNGGSYNYYCVEDAERSPSDQAHAPLVIVNNLKYESETRTVHCTRARKPCWRTGSWWRHRLGAWAGSSVVSTVSRGVAWRA
jgi:hypothetical protein